MNEISKRQIIRTDTDDIINVAAERLIARMDANPAQIKICLTGGSSPRKLYQLLATSEYASRIPWQRVHWFIGDERFVPPDDPLNNMTVAREAFLDAHAPVDNIHPIDTAAASPDIAADKYETLLRNFHLPERPLFDLVLLGIGPDGHVGSLFPGYPQLNETDKWVTGVPQANVPPFVPRVTLTMPQLCSTHEILVQLSGAEKRPIVTRLLSGKDLPANHAIAIGETIWLCDDAALPEDEIG